MTQKIKQAKIQKCIKKGHDWYWQMEDTPFGWMKGTCMRCGANQWAYIGDDVAGMDDDGTTDDS